MSALHGPAVGMRRKAFTLGALQALVRLACSFVSVKLTAVYLGPAGLALIAQFNNFMSLCQGIVVTALETATIRLGAEYRQDVERRRALLGTVGKLGLVLGVSTALLIAIASPWLSAWLLKDSTYAWVFVAGAFGVLATIVNAMVLAVLTVAGDISRVVSSNILATILGVVAFAPAAVLWGVAGGLYASAFVYVGSLLITLALASRSSSLALSDFTGGFDRGEAARIAGFYRILVFHAVMAPLSLILIREHVTSHLSLESAGLWQAAWRLSETYTMVVIMSATTQYMARLGEVAHSPARLRAELLKTMAMAVSATAALALAIYLLRDWIVRLLFSRAFLPVTDLLPIQLTGDVVKMVGSMLGYGLVATSRNGWYIAIEIAVPSAFILAARALTPSMGVSGVPSAYVIAGVIQSTMTIIALRDVLFMRARRPEDAR
jgi:PST family polysaccharide transporter